MNSLPRAVHIVRRTLVGRVQGEQDGPGERVIPEEMPVAFTYGSATFAVMMATPADLENFAYGFSLTEGIAERPEDITALEIVPHETGIELRMELNSSRTEVLDTRRRSLTGPVGCGLCGIESLQQAVISLPKNTASLRVTADDIFAALDSLRDHQRLNAQTRAVHGAGLWSISKKRFLAVREDVGRHNALDKLCGALAHAGQSAAGGIVVLTSRVSVDMVQKAARMGAAIIVAVSAPTALALNMAEEAGLTVIGVARSDSFEIFTHPERILTEALHEL